VMARAPRGASLRTKLSLLMLAVLFGASACAIAVKSWSDRRWATELQYQLNGEVADHIAASDHFFEDGAIRMDAAKSVFMKAMVVNPSLEIYLLDAQGKVLAFDAPEELVVRRQVQLADLRAALEPQGRAAVMGDDPRSHDGRKPIGVAPVGDAQGYVYVVLGGQLYDAIATDLFERSSMRWAIALILLSFLVAAGVSSVSLRVLVRPLEHLREGMAAFRRGERVKLRAGSDEVGDLTRDFQRMSKQIRGQLDQLAEKDDTRREFVANISHDLRTPTAAVLGYLEAAASEVGPEAEVGLHAHLHSATRQAERLSRLVDQLFELARLEIAERPPEPESFSLAELVQDVVCKFELASRRHDVALGAIFPTDLPDVFADIGLVERALDNLIENALRHSDSGGGVRVRLVLVSGGIRVQVEDEGPGIPADELPRLQERHYRGRGARKGGLGLGLAITRRIVELHEGELSIASTPGSGASFSFALPTTSSARRGSISKVMSS